MANRLGAETSPYLRQHADNPVDWYPWGAEALDRARAEGKPIVLSIGYSACHWCHVMAHESFEDTATAALMNRLYVNIKVDREERPDLDHLYQATHRMLGDRGGGWPLTVLLTPDLVPFFSGTYFPPTPRHGLPAFRDLLERAEHIFRTKPDDIARLSVDLHEALARAAPRPAETSPTWDREPIERAAATLVANIDRTEGGFGPAGRGPKFPQPQLLAFCLRHHPQPVLLTLRKMAEGGIYDQLGGGFCRYSVDASWTIPHFEKMLYDNGALLALYADAWLLTGEPLFARVVEETVAWALREMRAPAGGFFSALDADSEGEEGRFYVWSRDEIATLLDRDEAAVARAHYGLDGPPNFEGTAWHLRVALPLDAVAADLGCSVEAASNLLQAARRKLMQARATRVRPGLDDKILTSWNALMVRGLARAARVFGREDWLAQAQATADFLRTALWRDGRLYATFQGGRARHGGYLDDAAFLLEALLELMQARFRPTDLDFASELARSLLERFQDGEHGGFFFTAHDHEALLHRDKPAEDGATPSGNGVAAFALQRLMHVTGEASFGRAAERTLAVFEAPLREAPYAMPSLLGVLEEHLVAPTLVVLRGPKDELPPWQARLAATFRPHLIALALDEALDALPPVLSHPRTSAVAAYVCVGTSCSPAIMDPETLAAALDRAQ